MSGVVNERFGGSAFPGPWYNPGKGPQQGEMFEPGMTLWDYFAGKALTSIIRNVDTSETHKVVSEMLGVDLGKQQGRDLVIQFIAERVARGAYMYANAMIAIRKQEIERLAKVEEQYGS